jgi:hypothetical protein
MLALSGDDGATDDAGPDHPACSAKVGDTVRRKALQSSGRSGAAAAIRV